MAQPATESKRFPYLDFLRILAAFLVIVNHTNSLVFEKLSPAEPTWWLSLTWYYLSKIAVPLFIMVSGACLLPRRETYRRTFERFLRVLLVLVLASYVYYLADLWQTGWSAQRALDIPGFLLGIWQKRITDSFWYLYFYLGLMVMLPILRRLAAAMGKADLRYFLLVSFGVYAVWPLLIHYVPALALPQYFDLPLFSVLIGLFFAGHALHTYATQPSRFWNLLLVLASLAASVALTRLEYGRVGAGEHYWFMDERTAPSIFIILCAMGTMQFVRKAFQMGEPRSASSIRRWATVGGCAFAIYLMQDLLIAETRYRFFAPMSQAVNPLLAALVWEVGVFLIAWGLAWLLKHIPLVNRLL
ncbi:MAG: acyltransferase family protein [Candidatus Limiplasma sp.]|nr:acyltransferase family protein [Candidatus Limiplasma sp.]